MDRTTFSFSKIQRKGGMAVDVNALLLPGEDLDGEIQNHLRNIAKLPGTMRVSALPNIAEQHALAGGFVYASDRAIVPGVLGDDLYAGARILSTSLSASDVRLQELEKSIRSSVPFGEKSTNLKLHEGDIRLILEFGIAGLSEIGAQSGPFWQLRNESEEESDARATEQSGSFLTNSSVLSHHAIERAQNQLGTAGGAGHFIEALAVDGIFDKHIAGSLQLFKDQLLVSLCSGSRGLGRQAMEDFTRLARELNGDSAPERELAFFTLDSPEGETYMQAVQCVANFAFANRQVITTLVRGALRKIIGNKSVHLTCDASHNSLRREEHNGRRLWVHRRNVCGVSPEGGSTPGKPGAVSILSGAPDGASYILKVGTNSATVLNSLPSDAGKPGRNVDRIVRCLVDSGVAEIVARLRPLATIM